MMNGTKATVAVWAIFGKISSHFNELCGTYDRDGRGSRAGAKKNFNDLTRTTGAKRTLTKLRKGLFDSQQKDIVERLTGLLAMNV